MSASDVYGIYASCVGSTVTLQIPEHADPTSKIYIGNRILAEQTLVVRAAASNFTAETFELDLACAIEVLSQSISLSGADTML
ncbi:MAG: hypothetical protein ACK56F_12190, partial [bacterium]